MKMVKHDNIVKLYEVLASRTKVRYGASAAESAIGWRCIPLPASH